MNEFVVWVQSRNADGGLVEVLDQPFLREDGSPYISREDPPMVGKPGLAGLSDSQLGHLFLMLQQLTGRPLPLVAEFGLEGLCVMNMDFSEGDPTNPDSNFWRDTDHVHEVGAFVASGKRLLALLEERNPAIMEWVNRCDQRAYENLDEFLEIHRDELGRMIEHAEWARENRTPPVLISFKDQS